MRFETFAFLPPLSPQQIEAQLITLLKDGQKITVEFAESPTSADFYWRQWPIQPSKINSLTGQPEPISAGHIVAQMESCARRHPYAHVRVTAYCPQTRCITTSFITKTPQEGQ